MIVAQLNPSITYCRTIPCVFSFPLVFLWLALGGLPGVISNEGIPHALRSILVLPPAMILAAAYLQYFVVWATNPVVAELSMRVTLSLGREINALPQSTPKYVVADVSGLVTGGIPMPAETVMFITDSFLPEEQASTNIGIYCRKRRKPFLREAGCFT
jgi:hypothetical protein